MNPKHLLLLLPAAAITGIVLAQGPLTPPGAPAPVMKSLDQIEPRTPVSTLPFTISQSGSYYFTRNLQFKAASGDAITISAACVTLDLIGFKLGSDANVTGSAIRIDPDVHNVSVKNGIIAGNTDVTVSGTAPNQVWRVDTGGFLHGISTGDSTDEARNCHFSHLQISNCRSTGLRAGEMAVIEHVTAQQNVSYGIHATSGRISNSVADSNAVNGGGQSGIYLSNGSVTNCVANSNEGNGIDAPYCSVANSMAKLNGAQGFNVYEGSIANCVANRNGSMGMQATNGSITNSMASSNWSHGIFAPSGSVTNSTANLNGADGISASSGVIAFCRASENNARDIGRVDIVSTGSTRTGNNPAP
jgi:hypothetical protein